MDVSSDIGVIALFLAGVFVYIAFLLWTPKKHMKEPNRPVSFLIGLLLSILLYFVFMLGFVAGGAVFGLITFSHTVSYIMGGIGAVLLCAYTIKILPSKICDGSIQYYFSILTFIIYIVLGIGEIAITQSLEFSFDMIVTGISSIGVALCSAVIPAYQKKAVAKSTPVQTAPPSQQAESPVSSIVSEEIVSAESESLKPAPISLPREKHSAPSHVSLHFSINKRFLIVLAVAIALLTGLAFGIFLGEGYFSPYFTPSSPYINSLKEEAETAYSNGYNVGYTLGNRTGYDSGAEAGQSKGHSYGYVDGYGDGYSDGYSDGYNEGYDDCYYGN